MHADLLSTVLNGQGLAEIRVLQYGCILQYTIKINVGACSHSHRLLMYYISNAFQRLPFSSRYRHVSYAFSDVNVVISGYTIIPFGVGLSLLYIHSFCLTSLLHKKNTYLPWRLSSNAQPFSHFLSSFAYLTLLVSIYLALAMQISIVKHIYLCSFISVINSFPLSNAQELLQVCVFRDFFFGYTGDLESQVTVSHHLNYFQDFYLKIYSFVVYLYRYVSVSI